jgi:glycosyltransferase involved in cell wall biosynthesis
MASQSSPPAVSVVIPAFQAEPFLADAIESVLEQTTPPVDCVVVDDGSTDRTADVARTYEDRGVRLIVQPNRGVSAARNRGASAARCDHLSFLDADDIWARHRLARMLEEMGSDHGAVLSAAEVVDANLRPRGSIRLADPLNTASILLGDVSLVSVSSNLLVRRSAFETIGGFDERLSTSADWAFLLELVDRFPVGYVDEPLTRYRRHQGNMSRSVEAMERDMRLVYDEVFAGRHAVTVPSLIRRRAYASLHRMLAGSYLADGRYRDFARHAMLSLASHPSELSYFLAYPLRRLRQPSRASPIGREPTSKR